MFYDYTVLRQVCYKTYFGDNMEKQNLLCRMKVDAVTILANNALILNIRNLLLPDFHCAS